MTESKELTAKMRDIVLFPDQALSKKCAQVSIIDESITALVFDMLITMRAGGGIGIAAPQVGDHRRVIICDIDDVPLVMINPVVLSGTGAQKSSEGCLSLPGYFQEVIRKQNITVVYQDINGTENVVTASGLKAVVIQHEMDHLEGKTIVDLLPFTKRLKMKFTWKNKKA